MSRVQLHCQGLDVEIAALPLVKSLNLSLSSGEFVAIIGCNGAGKTTLMHTLAGVRDTQDGAINLLEKPLSALAASDIARHIALLTQQQEDAFPATVEETVLLGRHPHLGAWEWESDKDRKIVADALLSLGLDELAHRDIATLSGGERQRVALAMVLTQQPDLYLLDEPLNNLDPHHQIRVLQRFKNLCADGATTVAILHDLNLVARFADKVLLLYGPDENGRWSYGETDDCMTTDNLSRLYKTSIQKISHEGRSLFVAA